MSSYVLRLPESLKLASKRIAAANDTTMNQFFVVAIAEKISAMETADFFERRSAAAFKTKADKAWAKVGNKQPMLEDRWESLP
jgi:hypothetical protein